MNDVVDDLMSYRERGLLVPLTVSAVPRKDEDGLLLVSPQLSGSSFRPLLIKSRTGRFRDVSAVDDAGDALDVEVFCAAQERADQILPGGVDNIWFNQPLDRSAINVYLIDNDPEGRFFDYRGGCTSLGYQNIVICDASYLRLFGASSLATDEMDAQVSNEADREWVEAAFTEVARFRSCLAIYWVFLHEFGHVARGHSTRGCKVDGMPLDAGSEFYSQLLGGELPFDRREAEADAFLLDVLGDISEANRIALGWGIHAVITREGNRALRAAGLAGGLWDSDEALPLIVDRHAMHLPVFLRALGMYHQYCREYGYESSIRTTRLINRLRISFG